MATVADAKATAFSLLLHLVTYYVAAVLFGAPYFSLIPETAAFSALLSSLTVLPLRVFCGDSYAHALELFAAHRPKRNDRSAKFIVTLTVVGAWLGAFVIPLDWERWWQAWPISCCVSMTTFSAVAWGLIYTLGQRYPSFVNLLTSFSE